MAHVCSPLLSLVQQQPRRTITICEGRTATAQQLHDTVALLSWGLTHVLRLTPGARVALAGLNSDTTCAALLAVLDAGGVACPLNWRWSPAEAAAALAATAPALLLADEACSQLAAAAAAAAAEAAVQQQQQQQQQPLRVLHMTAALLQQPFAAAIGSSTCSSGAGASGSSIHTLQQLLTAAAEHHMCHHHHSRQQQPAPREQQQCQPQLQLALAAAGPGCPALICFTSGTTGASKGAVLSHSALMHQSLCKLAIVGYSADDACLHAAPLFHIGGLSSLLAVLVAGGAHVFSPRYSAAASLQLIQEHQVTAMIAVPAMVQDMVTAAAAGPAAAATLPSVRRLLVGAGCLSPQLVAAVQRLFPAARLTTAYGMTEGASSLTFISLHHQHQLMAAAAAAGGGAGDGESGGSADVAARGGVCVGLPAPGVALAIDPVALQQPGQQQQQQQQQQGGRGGSTVAAAAADGGAAPVGVVGEVLTRGPHVTDGYWADPAATSQVFTAGGWLRTGDLGCLDACGRLWLVGRLKDVVKSGGENVLAAEVEAALLLLPALAAAAVVGLPHARLGEQVAAAVELRPGWTWAEGDESAEGPSSCSSSSGQQSSRCVSTAALQQHCLAVGLSPFKLPRRVFVVRQLPLNSSGKVAKAQLRQQLLARLDGGSSSGVGTGMAAARRQRSRL